MLSKNILAFCAACILFCSALSPVIGDAASQNTEKTLSPKEQKDIEVICQIWKYNGMQEFRQNVPADKLDVLRQCMEKLGKNIDAIKSENMSEVEKARSNLNDIITKLKEMHVLPANMKNSELRDLLTGEYGRRNVAKERLYGVMSRKSFDFSPNVFSLFCSIESFGAWAIVFPLAVWFVIPLPVLFWAGEYGFTNVSGLIGSISYNIVGGFAIGFTGIVFSIPLFGFMGFSVLVLGYALMYFNPYYTP